MMLACNESLKLTHGRTKKSTLLKPSIWQKMVKTWLKLAWFKLVFWVKAKSIQVCCRIRCVLGLAKFGTQPVITQF